MFHVRERGIMQKKRRLILSLTTNLGLLLSGMAMAVSGFIIQFGYHMGHHGGIDETRPILGLCYAGWSNSHKMAITAVSLLMVAHIALHWDWYRKVVKKKLFAGNKLVISMTAIFILVAATGYIPWFIKLAGGSDLMRKIFVEVHDKITFFLFACLMIHVTKTFRWFIAFWGKMNKSRG